MARDYVHLTRQEEEIGWEDRFYSASESTFGYNGREVLLVEVEAGGCSFCDGSYAHNLTGANIEGYILKWKYRENEDQLPVSEIEPVRDSTEQKTIAEILKSQYTMSQINFT